MNHTSINGSHIGNNITIVYESRLGVFSKRTVHIIALQDNFIIAYCFLRKGVRRFNRNYILSFEVKKRREEVLQCK